MTQASRRPGNECLCLSPGGQYLAPNTPLIHWAEADLFHLLQEAAPVILVPEPVAREIRAYEAEDPTARALAASGWLEVRPVPPLSAQVLEWDL